MKRYFALILAAAMLMAMGAALAESRFTWEETAPADGVLGEDTAPRMGPLYPATTHASAAVIKYSMGDSGLEEDPNADVIDKPALYYAIKLVIPSGVNEELYKGQIPYGLQVQYDDIAADESAAAAKDPRYEYFPLPEWGVVQGGGAWYLSKNATSSPDTPVTANNDIWIPESSVSSTRFLKNHRI